MELLLSGLLAAEDGHAALHSQHDGQHEEQGAQNGLSMGPQSLAAPAAMTDTLLVTVWNRETRVTTSMKAMGK